MILSSGLIAFYSMMIDTCNDLATLCRIDSNFLIKITDFGLSVHVCVRNYFRQGTCGEMVKLPVKWMAPESLNDGHFSEKSDVVCVLLADEGVILIIIG